jgi:hypothetical protein
MEAFSFVSAETTMVRMARCPRAVDYCRVAQTEGLLEMNRLTVRAILEKAGVEFIAEDGAATVWGERHVV